MQTHSLMFSIAKTTSNSPTTCFLVQTSLLTEFTKRQRRLIYLNETFQLQMFIKIYHSIWFLHGRSRGYLACHSQLPLVTAVWDSCTSAESEHHFSFALPLVKYFMKTETSEEWTFFLWLNGKLFALVHHQKAIDSAENGAKPSLV